GNYHPTGMEHLFVSIQSFNSQRLWKILPSNYFDFIVVDEFHHSASDSYQKLLQYFNPHYLLALTATPERHDGLDVMAYFDYHIAAEIRLPDAINRKLLAPFQYFGITDSIDLSKVAWSAGHYDANSLNHLYNGNIQRAQLVLQKMFEILLNINKCRALCFCVGQGHAAFMNHFFNQHGVKSALLTAASPAEERNSIQQRLINYDINLICVVDIYNEGVDIPAVDTVLFLRPTESLTVFLQQLGRGLRLFNEKECLTVLDFVGNAHRNFNFESRFRAMLGSSEKNVADEIESGFMHLPAGCHIQLEKEAQRYILENIRNSINHGRTTHLVSRIATFEQETGLPLTLTNFIDYHHLALYDIYKRNSFARLCEKANLRSAFVAPDEKRLTKGLQRILHMNSAYQLQTLLKILQLPVESLSSAEERLLTMLHFSLWGKDSGITSLSESLKRLKANGPFFDELLDILKYLFQRTDMVTERPQLPYDCPLELHASYTRDEILAALGNWTLRSTPECREGVKYLPELRTDCFLITLNKAEKHYSPTTMYLDYAISDDLFHWQSQSTTSVESPTGQRYLTHRETGNIILLFVRENKHKCGQSSSYCFLGPAEYRSHSGNRPINIEWRLGFKMPARLCRLTERMATA
ncbi:MAG: DUF3427 domain-containing protein, partial [Victivallaceae bacterium]